MKITNIGRKNVTLVLKGPAKDGHPPTGSIPPGETVDLDVVENAQFQGLVLSGAISVPSGSEKKAAKAAGSTPSQ
jgi:hypothetical protein